jgi:AcrR family transcriptional regulator
MERRGRPKGVDSADTRVRIMDAARVEFASSGYEGASVAMISSASDLAPSAIYHYFGGKAALYEEVFEVTTDAMWTQVDLAASEGDTVLASVEAIVGRVLGLSEKGRQYIDFLALSPMEATLRPEFAHLLDRRTKWQEATFTALAEKGIKTGELDGFDITTGTEMVRSLIMGWFFEAQIQGQHRSRSGESLVTLFRILGDR